MIYDIIPNGKTLLFYLGSDADAVLAEHLTQEQESRERADYLFTLDTSDIPE